MSKSDGEVDLKEKVRISPRISRGTYALAKAIYPMMGVTLEDRVEFLLARDLAKEMKKPWFKKLWSEEVIEQEDEND